MILVHPFMQAAGSLLVLAVFATGLQRVRSRHLGQKASFPWKLHVLLGRVALVSLLVGASVGFDVVHRLHRTGFMVESHDVMGVLIVPFLLFALVSGYLLDRQKGKRPRLGIVHGVSNTVLLLLLLNQARTGLEVLRLLLSGS